MGKVKLLDCTLRDGGYINDWFFGEEAIKGIITKISQTGVEIIEVGFIKGTSYDPNRSVFPNTACFKNVIGKKADHLTYVGMLDMSAPVAKESIMPRDSSSIDGIRVIFKKNKINEAYEYCQYIKKQGYSVFANFVSTDQYSDKEFIEGIEKFNTLHLDGVAIVDTFGMIKRKQFMRLAAIADNNLEKNIMLCYHAHNNLQQAFGNAEALMDMNLKRDICVDACIFGMGRGAGNLNLELFAEFMNENYNANYKIEPMLEIMDEYLAEVYKSKFWGYSLPLYLSAAQKLHPNYAIYLAEKDTLTVKMFNEILKSISPEDKITFSQERAEKYYVQYMENYIDDKNDISRLANDLTGKRIVMLAPGRSLSEYVDIIKKEINKKNTVTIAVNFIAEQFKPNYIFSSNMRRFTKIQGKTEAKYITTSNMKDCEKTDFVVNFSSFSSKKAAIVDNSGVMLLRLLAHIGVKEVFVAGMDGYSPYLGDNYFDNDLEYDYTKEAELRNVLISSEIRDIGQTMSIKFITPTIYIMKQNN